jgi:hypothetical protein
MHRVDNDRERLVPYPLVDSLVFKIHKFMFAQQLWWFFYCCCCLWGVFGVCVYVCVCVCVALLGFKFRTP